MSDVNVSEIMDAIEELVREERYTAYGLAKLANEILSAFEIKNIPPQMCYNYVRKGFITSVVENGQQLVLKVDAVNWLQKYISNKLA